MRVVQCENGHFYDADMHGVCPHCNPASGKVKQNHGSNLQNALRCPACGAIPEKSDAVFCTKCGQRLSAQSERREQPIPEKKNPTGGGYPEPVAEPYDDVTVTGSFEVVRPQEAPSDSYEQNKENLMDAVKAAAADNGERTIGIFSMGAAASAGAAQVSEPVVGWLVCIKGPHIGESFPLFAGRNSLGRGAENRIRLTKDQKVSREKCMEVIYEPKNREFFVRPAGGSGIIYVDGKMLSDMQKIESKEQIEIGAGLYILVALCGKDFSWEDYIQ